MLRTLTLFFAGLVATPGFAQEHATHRGVCGTEPVDEVRLRANIARARAGLVSSRSRETTYIPVRFKLFGRSDSTGVATANSLLSQMSAINVDFAPLNIQFFLEDGDGSGVPWEVYYDDALYERSSEQTDALNRIRASNAITVYVPDNATPPNSQGLGTTLGYYSRTGDFLVFKRTEVGENASTASHEFGHYFGLPHTFRGWDCTSWNGTSTDDEDDPIMSPVDTNRAPCFNVPVELVTRGALKNCEEAGDLFCDTPADYNLGFGYGGCDYVGEVADANGELLRPDANNFMGYFIGCNPYFFSEEQKAAMFADLERSERNFLKRVQPRSTDTVAAEVSFISPGGDDETTLYGDILELEWEPIAGAEYYLVQIATAPEMNRGTQEAILPASQTSYVFDGLDSDRRYYYRARAFNQTSFGVTGTTRRVMTGDRLSGVTNTVPSAGELTLLPNPAVAGGGISVRVGGTQIGEAQLTIRDLTGRIVSSEWISYLQPNVVHEVVGSQALPRGAYALTLATEAGLSTRKFVVE